MSPWGDKVNAVRTAEREGASQANGRRNLNSAVVTRKTEGHVTQDMPLKFSIDQEDVMVGRRSIARKRIVFCPCLGASPCAGCSPVID